MVKLLTEKLFVSQDGLENYAKDKLAMKLVKMDIATEEYVIVQAVGKVIIAN